MTAFNQTVDEAACRMYARGQEQPFSFSASGSPRFVGTSMGAAVIAHGIGEAIAAHENFADCMEVKGYVPIPAQAAPIAVATAAPPPSLPAQSSVQPSPVTASLVASQTAAEADPVEITEIRAVNINPIMADMLKIKPGAGAYVTGIDRSGQPSEADLQPGDVILDFGGQPVHQVDDLERQMARTHVHATVHARVRRDDAIRYVLARF